MHAKKARMPLDYLRKIEHAGLPLLVDDRSEINSIAVLVAAGMVEAVLPPVSTDENAEGRLPAVVKLITPRGRAELLLHG
jgi:hypothetical protein